MALMSPTDSVFLLPETREQPMHVGSLQLYRPPDGADVKDLSEIYEGLISVEDIDPLFRKRAYRSPSTLGQWAWATDRTIDLEHHVRHSALPYPGRIRELLALTSRLHSTLLDRHRPLWETHLIEGLQDGRFAIYTKVHHALMDGVAGLKLLQDTLSFDPDDHEFLAPYSTRPHAPRTSAKTGGHILGLPGSALALPGAALDIAQNLLSLGPAAFRVAEQALGEQAATLPMTAPKTILNGAITGARRFAAESWPLARITSLADAADVTVNDVILAMSSGALRTYLTDLDALPDASLTAMVPVSLRQLGMDISGGNAVGVILCSLGTDIADPADRLAAVHQSMNNGKKVLAGMNRLQVTALSGLAMGPMALSGLFGINRFMPPPFNLVISNVPGPRKPMYWNGNRLDAVYPLSIPTVGQAMNITVTSYNTSMEFGITGCRASAPHLQRLLIGLEDSLSAMEHAVA